MANKGLAFETIGYIILGVIGLVILLSFLGVIQISARNIFCSAYSNIAEPPAFCEALNCTGERYELVNSDPESFSRDIAAHAVTCFTNKAGCLGENDVRICYAMRVKNKPAEKIYEYNVTKLLEDEKGCDVLENDIIISETGLPISYPGNCGVNDFIDWRVKDIFIKGQSMILIEYDEANYRVVIKA